MNNIPIELKNGYIIIQDIKNETVTKDGLYIPDNKDFKDIYISEAIRYAKNNHGDLEEFDGKSFYIYFT